MLVSLSESLEGSRGRGRGMGGRAGAFGRSYAMSHGWRRYAPTRDSVVQCVRKHVVAALTITSNETAALFCYVRENSGYYFVSVIEPYTAYSY